MNTYRVEVTREGRWWMVSIPELDGLTQARRLEDAPAMARDFIALELDVPISEVDVAVDVIDVEGVNLVEVVAEIEAEKAAAEAARERVAEETRRLAKKLVDQKVPVRDVGSILGVSHQRAHQYVSSRNWP